MKADPIEVFYAVAHQLIAERRFRDAATILHAMIVGAPADERGWLALGSCHEGLDQLVVAKEILAAARTVVPNNMRISIALARSMRLLGECSALRDQVLDNVHQALADSSDDELLAALADERTAA